MSLLFVIFILTVFSIGLFFVWLWFFKGDSVSIEKIYKSGDKALKAGNFAKAKEMLLKVSESNSDPDVIKKLALTHFKLKEYEDAKKCFEQILKTSPNDKDALLYLAQILSLRGNDDEALEIYAKILEQDEQNTSNYINIANIHMKKGDSEKALEILEKAKEIAPDSKEVLFAITKCKSETCDVDDENSYNEVVNEFKKLSGDKDAPEEFDISLANLYAKNGEIDKALLHCKKALEANSEDVQASKLMGLIQLIKKDFAGAKNSLTAALNLQPSCKETHEIFAYLICDQDEKCERKKCRDTYHKLVKKHIK